MRNAEGNTRLKENITLRLVELNTNFLQCAKQFKTIPGSPWNKEAWSEARLTMVFKIIDDLVVIQSVVYQTD